MTGGAARVSSIPERPDIHAVGAKERAGKRRGARRRSAPRPCERVVSGVDVEPEHARSAAQSAMGATLPTG